jgi:hypothetical protein
LSAILTVRVSREFEVAVEKAFGSTRPCEIVPLDLAAPRARETMVATPERRAFTSTL